MELSEKLEVSVRTIYREINALSSAGIPVYAEQGRDGGIQLLDDFVLDKTVLSMQEKQEILAALQGISALWQQTDSQVLQKLSALFAAKTESWLEVDFSRWGSKRQEQEKFALLKWSILHQHVVKITYVGSRGQQGILQIEPLKLLYKSSAWYVQAFCREKQDLRVLEDGCLLVTTEMPFDEWVIGFILSFGIAVEIIEPQVLQQAVVQQVEKIYAHYKS